MRKLLALMAFVALRQVLGAEGNEAQTNALVESMLQSALIRPNFDRRTETVKGGPRHALSQMEFFSGDEKWSSVERRAAFDWYLQHLPTTTKSYGMIQGRVLKENPLARAAIVQCEIMGYTNAIPTLYDNARGVADPSRMLSVELLMKWTGINSSTVGLLGDIVSNEVQYASNERGLAYRLFCAKLLEAESAMRNDPSHLAGEDLMFRRRSDPAGAVAIDKLLVRCRTNYVGSVNRYESALSVLANTNASSNCIRYFMSVTNDLSKVSPGQGDES